MAKGKISKKFITFDMVMFGFHKHLILTRLRYPAFAKRLAERNLTAQIYTKRENNGYWFEFKDGKVKYKKGLHPNPGVTLGFNDRKLAVDLLVPPFDWGEQIHAQKMFKLFMFGEPEDTAWFQRLLYFSMTVGATAGVKLPSGETRYVNNTNGGPVHVDVKDGKIVRMVPIVLQKDDAASWTIKARGKEFTPPRKGSVPTHAICMKSRVYSRDRILYPMKRIDFHPHGERNCENRGVSDYERISWDEATTIVADEILRTKRESGPGAIGTLISAHHMWGNVGYHLSAGHRFWNLIGHTYIEHNPESWEGWFWGAMHHWGHSTRCGTGDPYGLVEDCLKNTDMIVFWSSDPESTGGVFGGLEGSIRRQWAKELGIEFVHIDPYYNHTAQALGGKWIAPRPGTSNALALAIAYVWIDEDLYDKDYIARLTTGFEEWKLHVMGEDGSQPKTPEWAEKECDVEAHIIRSLARKWGKTKTYLGAGGWGNGLGSANRHSTGTQWARSMVCLGAMQGMGKPGSNLGNLQLGTPVDNSFYFPGYAEGGISGDLEYTANVVNNYQRMPHLLTQNGVKQRMARLHFAESILTGKSEGNVMALDTVIGQYAKHIYPAPGHSPVEFLYRYGGSFTSTIGDSNKHIAAWRSPNLKFIVNQSIWHTNEVGFADIILPACTNFERWDIGEWAAPGVALAHNLPTQLNHRVIALQHKCIEPVGESKSDYEIFFEISKKLGFSDYYSEGMTEYDWVKRVFESSDLPKVTSWKTFLKKGYYVVPPEPDHSRSPVALNWFAEERKKDVPDGAPIASEYSGQWLEGLQTQSGKFEFAPATLRRLKNSERDRPVVNEYARGFEGYFDERRERYPLQMIAPHPRYSVHTMGDGTDSFLSEIEDHKVWVDGWPYNKVRINPCDAETRNIRDRDLIRVANDRGGVVGVAQVTNRIRKGTIHMYESSSLYRAAGEPGKSLDLGGGANQLSSNRMQIKNAHAGAGNSILCEVTVWNRKGEIQ